MSKTTVTDFSRKVGSPFQYNGKDNEVKIVHEDVLTKTHYELQKEKQNELMQKINKKTAEYQAHKPSVGVFTEVVTHGAFTSKSAKESSPKVESRISPPKIISNGSNGNRYFLGFPSSANDLALDAKTDLESDSSLSTDTKEKVIKKIFTLVSMVQHVYESKVRVMSEFEKFKEVHLKNELRREKEHSEQMYKLNMNFQNEVVQAIQQLKSEIDISRNVSKSVEDTASDSLTRNLDTSVDFKTSEDLKTSTIETNDNVE